MMFVVLLRVYIHTGQAEKFASPRWESNPRPLGSLKTDLRFARPEIRGSTERAKRRSDKNVVKSAFRPLCILQ